MALSLRFGLSVSLVILFVFAAFLLPGFVDTVLLAEDLLPSAIFAVLELFAEWVELSDAACSEVLFFTAIVSSFDFDYPITTKFVVAQTPVAEPRSYI